MRTVTIGGVSVNVFNDTRTARRAVACCSAPLEVGHPAPIRSCANCGSVTAVIDGNRSDIKRFSTKLTSSAAANPLQAEIDGDELFDAIVAAL